MAGTVSPGVSDFFGDEYQRFMQGLHELSGGEQDRRRKDLQRRGIDGTTPREVSIPQWDDIVHIRPRTPLTSGDRDEWRASRREGRLPDLPPDVVLELARRENRIEAMRRSAQPEYSQSWGSMMTALDNVQDFLASVSIAARVVTRGGEWLTGRALPGVGWVRSAADLLNLGMFFGNLALPAFAALCHGPRAALSAGIATGLMRAGGKGLVSVLAGVNPLSRKWRTPRLPSVAGRISLVGQALVVAQTTDQLYGYGLSLGPLVGYVMESVYADELRSRGETVTTPPAPRSREWWERAHPALKDVPTPALHDRLKAAGTLRGMAPMSATQAVFTHGEHVASLIATHQAVALVGEEWRRVGMLDAVPDVADLSIPAPAFVADPVPSLSLLDVPAPATAFRWPIPGTPAAATVETLVGSFAPKIPPALADLLTPVAQTPEGALLGILVNEITETLWYSLTNDRGAFQVALTPSQLALERLLAVHLLIHPGTDPARAWEFWTAALAEIDQHRHALKTRDDWRLLAASFDVELLLLLPPSVTTLEPATTRPAPRS